MDTFRISMEKIVILLRFVCTGEKKVSVHCLCETLYHITIWILWHICIKETIVQDSLYYTFYISLKLRYVRKGGGEGVSRPNTLALRKLVRRGG